MTFSSISAAETLIDAAIGRSESPAVKSDIAMAGTALSLVLGAVLPAAAPHVNVSGIDAALTKILTGITDLRAAIEAPSVDQAGGDPANTPAVA